MPDLFGNLGDSEPYVPNYLQDEIQFRIDNDLRTIAIPADGVVLGVVGDKNVNHVNFQMPAWYNGFDMSEFQARINFVDPEGNANYYTVNDMTVYDPEGNEVTGTPGENDTLYFTWLVDSYATHYAGTVQFSVRLFKLDNSDGVSRLVQAFNTQINACNVLSTIQLAEYISQEQVEDILYHYMNELGDTAEELKADIEIAADAKKAEVLADIPDDYTTLSNRLSNTQTDLNKLAIIGKNELDGLNRTTGQYYNNNAGVITTGTSADTLTFASFDVPAGTYYFKYIYAYFSFYKTGNGTLTKFTTDTSNRWIGEKTFSDTTTLYISANTTYVSGSIVSNNEMVRETGTDIYEIKRDALSQIITKGVQYIDTNNMTDDKYYTNNGGTIGTGNGTGNTIVSAITLNPGTYYYKNIYGYFSFIANVGGGLTQISSSTANNVSGSFILNNRQTVYLSIKTASKSIATLSNVESDSFTGEQYFIKPDLMKNYTSKTDEERTHVLRVKKDGSGDYTTLKAALAVCAGATNKNKYLVEIYTGVYDILEELGGNDFLSGITSSSGNRLGLVVPNYTSIVGIGDVTLQYLPDDSVSNYYTTQDVAPLEVVANTRIENIKIIAKNCRYCVHDETNNNPQYADAKHEYINCIFTHQGNKSGTWASPAAIASGTSSGCSYTYTNCVLTVPDWTPWSMHNNENQNTVTVVFDGVTFNGASSEGSIRFGYYKHNTSPNHIFIKNCKATSGIIIRKEANDTPSDNVWNLHNYTDIEETII